MLAKMKCYIDNSQRINKNMGSLFHGYIIENISSDYSKILHNNSLNPFSQGIGFDNKGQYWEVCTTTTEAYENIILPIESRETINIKSKNTDYNIIETFIKKTNKESMIENLLFNKSPNNYVGLKFVTPTAFKSQGEYVNMPSIRLIFQSLLMKLDSTSEIYKYASEDTIKDIEENTRIVRYKLNSSKFHLEGSVIPSFIGEITLKVYGPDMMKNLLHMLISYGEYSGVGIKTGLGMGKIEKIGSEKWTTKNMK